MEPTQSQAGNPKPQAPERIGRYELVYEVAREPLSVLWAARIASGPDQGRTVFLRRVAPRPGVDAGIVDDVCQAAWCVMDLRGSKILSVLDVVVSEGSIGVASEYMEGESLRQLMRLARTRSAPFPVPVAVRITCDLLDGLAMVHAFAAEQPDSAEFVAGGLLPDRVLVSDKGQTSLCAIELWSKAAVGVLLSLDRELVISRAPEQLKKAAQVDCRADVFVAGVLLWEMIANRPLFRSGYEDITPGALEDSAAAKAVFTAPIDGLDAIEPTPSVATAGVDVVARALDRDRDARFASAQEMNDALIKAIDAMGTDADVAAFVDKLARLTLSTRRSAIQKAMGGATNPTSRTPPPGLVTSASAAGPARPEQASAPSLLRSKVRAARPVFKPDSSPGHAPTPPPAATQSSTPQPEAVKPSTPPPPAVAQNPEPSDDKPRPDQPAGSGSTSTKPPTCTPPHTPALANDGPSQERTSDPQDKSPVVAGSARPSIPIEDVPKPIDFDAAAKADDAERPSATELSDGDFELAPVPPAVPSKKPPLPPAARSARPPVDEEPARKGLQRKHLVIGGVAAAVVAIVIIIIVVSSSSEDSRQGSTLPSIPLPSAVVAESSSIAAPEAGPAPSATAQAAENAAATSQPATVPSTAEPSQAKAKTPPPPAGAGVGKPPAKKYVPKGI